MAKYKPKYWSSKGRFQEEYESLYKKLVPDQGDATTFCGEVLRIASKVYYDIYNNGGCNLRNKWFVRQRNFLLVRMSVFQRTAEVLKVAKFPQKFRYFLTGEAPHHINDEVIDVMIKFVESEYGQIRSQLELVEAANKLIFLTQDSETVAIKEAAEALRNAAKTVERHLSELKVAA